MVCLTMRSFDTALVVRCPKCKTCSKLYRPTDPQIDSCGFESYSFHCGGCHSPLAGIVDPLDDELLVSLLEPASGVSTTPCTREKEDFQTERPTCCTEKVVPMVLVSAASPSIPRKELKPRLFPALREIKGF
jgi:phage FluMu protein Com